MLQQVVTQLQQQGKQIDSMEAELKASSDLKQQYPFIDYLHEEEKNRFIIVSEKLKEWFTIREFVLYQFKENLDGGDCISLGMFVKSTITTLKDADPKTVGLAAVYNHDDIPALRIAYRRWQKSRAEKAIKLTQKEERRAARLERKQAES